MNAREKLRTDLIIKYQRQMDEEPNCDTEPWTCRVCGEGPLSRLYAILEHCLAHVRRDELNPIKKARTEAIRPGVRPLEVD